MKIAVATIGPDKKSMISEKGGRAPYYLIFEGKKFIKSISNPFAVGGGGSGIAVSKMLADMGVDMVITGKIGEKMEVALRERGLKFSEREGLAEDVVSEFSK